MTLNTSVYLLSEFPPHDVFWKCRELLNAPEDLPVFDEPSDWKHDDHWNLRNPGGVGLSAWLWMRYKPGEMRRPHNGCDADCEDDCSGEWHAPAHWCEVSFDTAYSYKDDQGRGCGVLHASLVAQLGQWLDERGVRWAWNNEFTGETHIGDRYERLFDLMGKGDDARKWFEEIVTPVIEASFGAQS